MSDDQDRLADDWERERKALLKEDEDHYAGPRSIADTLDELKKLYPNLAYSVDDDKHIHETGATRSKDVDDVRYDLISPVGLETLARRYALGASRHGANNWLKGMPILDVINHGIRHIYLHLSGDRSDDHLGAWAWAAFTAIHSDKMWPHLNAGQLCGPGCTPPEPPITEVEF